MKMNAFLRLIRTIACGVVVLGASSAIGQVNEGGATYGTLQTADENGNEINGSAVPSGNANAQQSFTQTQAPAVGDTSGAPPAPMYYPQGVEIPLTETEIPGSAYLVGPDGERIDSSTLMNQVPAGQERLIPSEGSTIELSPGQSFSAQGVYDGTLAFPMGTFPTTPFGERILSQEPTGESSSAEIEGALVDENGNSVDAGAENAGAENGETPGMENGVPVDQIVRPNNSVADATTVVEEDAPGQMRVLKPNESAGFQGLKGEVKISRDPDSGQVTLIGDEEDIALVASPFKELAKQAKPTAEKELDKNVVERHNRIKQRLQESLGEKKRLSGMLRKANQKTEALSKEVAKLKAGGKKPKADSDKSVEELQAKLKTSQTEKADLLKLMKLAAETAKVEISQLSRTERKLKESLRLGENTKKMMEDAQKATQEKFLKLQAEAEEKASQKEAKFTQLENQLEVNTEQQKAYRMKMEARLKAAEADAEKAKAEARALTQKMAADSAAMATTELTTEVPVAELPSAMAAQAGDMANKAKDAKAAAELEVSRKLKAMEERKKADEAAEAADEAAAENKNSVEADDKETVLSLDDQIKRLKAKRDQQIAESETRIRAKQQREIDGLLKEGKAVDSDEVKGAVEKMKGAIKTSEEKLRSRFLRRLERLKEDMKSR